jgi:hypothetical protein
MRNAVEGFGTDEVGVIALLANKTHEQIDALKEAYKVEHGELLKVGWFQQTPPLKLPGFSA